VNCAAPAPVRSARGVRHRGRVLSSIKLPCRGGRWQHGLHENITRWLYAPAFTAAIRPNHPGPPASFSNSFGPWVRWPVRGRWPSPRIRLPIRLSISRRTFVAPTCRLPPRRSDSPTASQFFLAASSALDQRLFASGSASSGSCQQPLRRPTKDGRLPSSRCIAAAASVTCGFEERPPAGERAPGNVVMPASISNRIAPSNRESTGRSSRMFPRHSRDSP